MKIIQNLLMAIGAMFLVFVVLALRPINVVAEEKCKVVTGKVTSIFEAGVKDVNFKLKDDPTRYYINRGLENGLSLDELKENLIGETVTIKYPPHWTPLDPGNRIKHISMVIHEGEVVFSEID